MTPGLRISFTGVLPHLNRRILLIGAAQAGPAFLMEFAVFGIGEAIEGSFHCECRAIGTAGRPELAGAVNWAADRQMEEAILWLRKWYLAKYSEELPAELAKPLPLTETELLYAKQLGFWNQGFGLLAKRARTDVLQKLAFNVVSKATFEPAPVA